MYIGEYQLFIIISAKNSEGLDNTKVHLQWVYSAFYKRNMLSVTWWQPNADINIFKDPMKFSSHFLTAMSSQSYSVYGLYIQSAVFTS